MAPTGPTARTGPTGPTAAGKRAARSASARAALAPLVSLAGLLLACARPDPTVADLGAPARSAHVNGPASSHVAAREPKLAASAVFVDDAEKVFPRRTRLARHGSVRFAPTGPPILRGSEQEPRDDELVVLESSGDLVRVLVTARGGRLALYLESEDLKELPSRVARLSLTSATTPVDAKAELYPGALVTWTERRSGARRALLADRDVEVAGWIEEDAIGRVYTPVPVPEVRTTHRVERRVDLCWSAEGACFGKLDASPDGPIHVRASSEARAGRRKIAVTRGRLLAEGWVSEDALIADDGQLGRLGGSHHSRPGGPVVHLPAGTQLFSGSTGEQVGQLLAETVLADRRQHEQGRGRVGFLTSGWGLIDVWAPDEAFERGKREREQWQRRMDRISFSGLTSTGGFDRPQWSIELEQRELLSCVEAAEKDGSSLAGVLRVEVLLDAEGAQESLKLSGPLSKRATFVKCLNDQLRVWASPNELRPRPGSIGVTVEIAPPPAKP